MKVKLLSVEGWRGCDGLWFWNQWYTVDSALDISEAGTTPRKLFKYLREGGYLSERSKGKLRLHDDGYNLVIECRGTGEPLFALCYGEDN